MKHVVDVGLTELFASSPKSETVRRMKLLSPVFVLSPDAILYHVYGDV